MSKLLTAGAGGWCRVQAMGHVSARDTWHWLASAPGPWLVVRRARWRSDAGDTLMQAGECHHCR